MISSPGKKNPQAPIVTPEKDLKRRKTGHGGNPAKLEEYKEADVTFCDLCNHKLVEGEDLFYSCIVCYKSFCKICNNNGLIVIPVHCPGCNYQACDECSPICRVCGGGRNVKLVLTMPTSAHSKVILHGAAQEEEMYCMTYIE